MVFIHRLIAALRILIVLLVILSLATTISPVLAADTITVTNGDDNGPGSLRAIVAAASPGQTIEFAPGLTTITLTSGSLPIGEDMTIRGQGVGGITIRRGAAVATPDFPIFVIGTGVSAILEGLSITNGKVTGNVGGGGIYNGGILTLTNTVVAKNSARVGGGIFNAFDPLVLVNSFVVDNATTGDGGGIYNFAGDVTLNETTVESNLSGTFGGGIYNAGTVALNKGTIADNYGRSGGGIYNNGGTVTLSNATVSGNASDAGGGIHNVDGAITLEFTTVVGNSALIGGGIFHRSSGGTSTTLDSSIVAGNLGHTGGADCGSEGIGESAVTSSGYNVVGAASNTSPSTCPANGVGDYVHTQVLHRLLNPALAANGGATLTHNLADNSPAIDRIPAAACRAGTDQRGIARPQRGACDSGAFESRFYTRTYLPTQAVQVFPERVTVLYPPSAVQGKERIGWIVNGEDKGWAPTLSITVIADHTLSDRFATPKYFPDVPSGRLDFDAIVELATRGIIQGYQDGRFGPGDRVSRAQMAALIARAMPAAPGSTPTNGTLAPPNCLVPGTWDCEDWGNDFSDRGGIDANLWRNAGAMQHYGVSIGYAGATCAAKKVPSPCFGPKDDVTYAQTISFITRAMKAQGYWVDQPSAPLPYQNVPQAHQLDARTFHFYTGGIPAPPKNWAGPATRGWFAQSLWAALDSYWGVDTLLKDGRPAGGYVP